MIKVKDSESLYRDPVSGAIINTNKLELDRFKQQRSSETILKNEVNHLKQEMSDIKLLLQQIISKI